MTDINYTSPTALIDRFTPPFDAEAAAAKIAEAEGSSVLDILDGWREKAAAGQHRGKLVHAFIEKACSAELLPRPPSSGVQHQAMKLDAKIKSTNPVALPYVRQWVSWVMDNYHFYDLGQAEVSVNVPSFGIRGKIDQMATAIKIDAGKQVLIDWKTSNRWSDSSQEKMLGPLAHLDNCSLVKVSLQLHMYAQLLAETGGEQAFELFCVHLRPDGWSRYDALPLGGEALALLEIAQRERFQL